MIFSRGFWVLFISYVSVLANVRAIITMLVIRTQKKDGIYLRYYRPFYVARV